MTDRATRIRFSSFSLRLLLLVLLMLSATTLCLPESAQAVDPSIKWETLETEHFSIIFDSRHYPLAARYAHFAEQAFAATAPIFRAWPDKTVILIDDSTDLANGFAVGVPYPLISSFPVLPTALDSISDYGNWGLELLTHEYTHVLNFEPATGVMRPLRAIFGSIVRPNMLLPRWYLEGLAVEMETRLSSFGRLRSANYLAIPRAMVETSNLSHEDISRINEVSIPDWPGGIRPYLMGALLWNELTRTAGDKVIGDLNEAYSRRVPFFINGPIEERFGGLGFEHMLAKTYSRVERQANKQLEQIHAAGPVPEKELEQEGYFNHSPTVSPDGKALAYIGRRHDIESFIALAERPASERQAPESAGSTEAAGKGQRSFAEAGKARRIVDGTSINRLSWLPDSTGIIYDNVDTVDRHYEYSDLWRYTIADKKKTQLTKGLRAREPALSPDGRTIVFVRNTPGSTHLSSIQLDPATELPLKVPTSQVWDETSPSSLSGNEPSVLRALYVPPIQTRIARPEFLSANEVIFTEKRDDGAETLKILSLVRDEKGGLIAKGEPRTVLAEFNPVHFPRLTSEGLLFVSDRSGVANLYLASRDLKTAKPVTNTPTRVMTGELDPTTGELYYSRLTAAGPRIFSASHESWSHAPARLPQVGPLVDYEWPHFTPPVVEDKAERHDFSVWPYMIPRYWMPYFFFLPEGSYVSASTAANDPTGRHAYSISASYDSLTQRPSFVGQYLNAATPVHLAFTGEDLNEYIYSEGFSRHSTAGSILGSFYLPRLSEDWHGALGWQYLQTELDRETLVRNGAQASIQYSNATQKGLQISPEKGGAFSLAHTQYIPALGNIAYGQTDGHGAYYFSRWLPEHHVLAGMLHVSAAPGLNRARLGRTTVGGNYQGSLIQNAFVMRGYGSGAFLGKSLASATLEYRFPLSYPYQGWGTSPFFIKRWHAALFADALTLDGYSYDYLDKKYQKAALGSFFVGTGAEVKADATVFYHLSLQFIFGLYYGLNKDANPYGVTPFIGLGL